MAAPNILDYYADLNTSFLHGAGAKATDQLIRVAALETPATLFELGCGTGASLVHLAHNFPALKLTGGDISPVMLAKAKKRRWISGLSNRIKLTGLELGAGLPFSESNFDYVLVESVLAIQSSDTLQNLLQEVHHILKPGGKLLMNETLWLEGIPVQERTRINGECLQHFGIIQANTQWATTRSWRSLLLRTGFDLMHESKVDDEIKSYGNQQFSRNPGSVLFDTYGKIKRTFHPGKRKETQYYSQQGNQIMGTAQKLNAYLFVADCQK